MLRLAIELTAVTRAGSPDGTWQSNPNHDSFAAYMEYIIGFAVLLGVLVFIHELGHFSVAKAFGMRVETFSIGMGKKIWSKRRGETEYALSILPLGGYVKITGQDPREEVPPELVSRTFRSKPLYQRALVVLAGPIFNLVLAIFVFCLLVAVGLPVPSAQLARVLPGSPAAESGFKSGDLVVSVTKPTGEKHSVRQLMDLERILDESANKDLVFEVQRSAGLSTRIPFSPVLGEERDSTIGVIRKTGVMPGVERRAVAPVIVADPKSWAAARQITGPLWISKIESGQSQFEIESFEDLATRWAELANLSTSLEQGEIRFIGHRIEMVKEPKDAPAPKEEVFTLAWTQKTDSAPVALAAAGIFSTEMMVTDVKTGSPAEKLGLKPGDRIVSLQGEAARSFASFRARLQQLATEGQSLRVAWVRNGESFEAETKPDLVESADPLTEVKRSQFQIGAQFLALQAAPPMGTLKAQGPLEILTLGWDKTWDLTASMLSSFYHLAVGDISPKTLGGPILIGKIAGESIKQGWVSFLRMMAFISLNLFILNLLPIPVLDGGHLLLYSVEAIIRRPLSIKIVEVWTTAGFFMLMGLVAVVFFNDLSRLGLFKIFGG